MVKCLPAVWETWVRSLGQEDPLEKEMATHSSTLAWKIPWTEEPGRLQSMGLQRVRHDWVTSLCAHQVLWNIWSSREIGNSYSGTQLSVLCFAQIKQFARCECDHSAEWNSSPVGSGSLIEACSWNLAWFQKEHGAFRGSSQPRNRTWVSPLQAEPGVKAGFHRNLREGH